MFVNGEEVSRPADQQLRQMIYSTLEDFDLLEPQWRMLESELGSSLLPFQTFAWNRAWWKVFNSQAFPRRDKLSIIAFYDGIRLVAVVPLFETGVGVGNWRPLRYLRPFGADANLTELRIPLALPEHLSAVFDHLLNFMSLAKDAPLALQVIGPAAAIENAAKRHPNLINIHSRTVRNHILTLGTDWENSGPSLNGISRNLSAAAITL